MSGAASRALAVLLAAAAASTVAAATPADRDVAGRAASDASAGRPDRPGAASPEAAQRYFTDRRLVDQNGSPRRFYSDVLKDSVVLINFIFTHCEDTCPIQSRKVAEVQSLLGAEAGRGIRLVSISIDPARDTPKALKTFSERYDAGPGWIFLTGAPQDVSAVVGRLGQIVSSPETHSTLFILGNVSTGHWMKLRPDATSAAIARHLRTLATERPGSPPARN